MPASSATPNFSRPNFTKQATQVSMLNADTKFMPVGDLDFGVPGADKNHNTTT